MLLDPKMDGTLKMELDQDPELNPMFWKWDTDKTGARDGVHPKLKYKGYNPNMDLELEWRWPCPT